MWLNAIRFHEHDHPRLVLSLYIVVYTTFLNVLIHLLLLIDILSHWKIWTILNSTKINIYYSLHCWSTLSKAGQKFAKLANQKKLPSVRSKGQKSWKFADVLDRWSLIGISPKIILATYFWKVLKMAVMKFE